jgi:hypothetical protein
MSRRRIVRIGFWVVLAVAAALVIRSVVDGGDSSGDTTAPEIVTLEELRDAASSEGKPIYWAGVQAGTELELSRPDQERTYVRYLTGGAEAGAKRSEFLTVGTYAFPGAAAALKELSQKPGGVRAATAGGGIIYFDRSRPRNVYLAYPAVDVEIEVYDPDPKRALGLVASGQIVPVG